MYENKCTKFQLIISEFLLSMQKRDFDMRCEYLNNKYVSFLFYELINALAGTLSGSVNKTGTKTLIKE